jgi:hypothetical protein
MCRYENLWKDNAVGLCVKKVIFLLLTLGMEEDHDRPEEYSSLKAAENFIRLTHPVQYLLKNCAAFRLLEIP